jgi:putative phosphoribosyl transferase
MLFSMSAEVRDLLIHTRDRVLPGVLTTPPDALGVVLFAHGSGSSRLSPRNQMVAARLVSGGLATLLFDLLDGEEAADRSAVFDVPLLAERLEDATAWLRDSGVDLPVGYFGASTGAGAALWAAAELGVTVRAVVSRGGRPDLAASRLPAVTAPTLLIVGGHDEAVLELNQEAKARMRCPTLLEVVPGATHLFEEPGALESVATLATRWFRAHLGGVVEG